MGSRILGQRSGLIVGSRSPSDVWLWLNLPVTQASLSFPLTDPEAVATPPVATRSRALERVRRSRALGSLGDRWSVRRGIRAG